MKERGFLLCVAVLFLVVGFVSSDNVTTELDVPNAPPSLVQNIPDQSWAANTNLIGAFDLDDYFVDSNGDSISYYFTSVENISITINSNNSVSFYPDSGFLGVRNVTFLASDGLNNGTSNLVGLYVGTDTEPPKWSSPLKSVTSPRQNDYVNLSTSWTDNLQLKDYLLSIKQGAVFSNTSRVNFSGVQNISISQIQVSAASGSVVYWFFCARDTNDNANCTSVQNFSVAASSTSSTSSGSSSTGSTSGGGTGTTGGTSSTGSGIIAGLFSSGKRNKGAANFTVDPKFFKISLKQGNTETRVLKISNIGNSNISFEVRLQGLEDMVLLSDDSFVLEFGSSKSITIDFSALENTPVEEYHGIVIVNSSIGEISVPIVVDVNAREFEFEIDANVSEDSKRVNPGDDVSGFISIYNLKDVPFSEVNVYYAIKDLYGNIYDSGDEMVSLEDKVILDRTLHLPEDSPVGTYLFYARVRNDDFVAIDSDTFGAGFGFDFASFFRYTFFIVVIVVLSAILIILFLRYRHQREKERLLSLYLMLSEMKELIKDKKVDKAVDLYVRIKSIYGEPVSKTALENKNKLKEEIQLLSKRLEQEVSVASLDTKEEIKNLSEEDKKSEDSKKESPEDSSEKSNEEKSEDKKEEKKEVSKNSKIDDKEEEKKEVPKDAPVEEKNIEENKAPQKNKKEEKKDEEK